MPAPKGSWEDAPENSGVTGIHAVLLKDGNVLLFYCRTYPFWSRIYQTDTNSVSLKSDVVPKWPKVHDNPQYLIQPSEIFCSGHCALTDGRILVAGGELTRPYPYSYEPIDARLGLRYSFIYDPYDPNNPWKIPGTPESPHIMKDGRWYPTLTMLHNGQVIAMGGLSGSLNSNMEPQTNRTPERYDANGWTAFIAPEATMPPDISYFYPDGQVIPFGPNKGKIFYSTTAFYPDNLDPPAYYIEGNPQIFDPFASGGLPYRTPQVKRSSPSEHSAGLLLPIRKGTNARSRVLISGGIWGHVNVLGRVDFIDVTDPSSNPQWQSIFMQYPRMSHQAILLPDRTLLFIGGNTEIEENGQTIPVPVEHAELLDTDTMTWIDNEITKIPIARMYHSTGLLLPNGKILMAGGRVPDSEDIEDDTERRLSLYSPGYLEDGEQPIITDPPEQMAYGQTFSITVHQANTLDSVCLMKLGSVTHGNNMDQRYVELEFEPGSRGVYTIHAPADAYLAPPGYYMLFVLKDKSESVSGLSKIPSYGHIVKLGSAL